MKAMVLAAGLGTRMRPLSSLVAKPVLPVLNRPLLAFTLDALRRAGVDEAIVNTHHLPATVRSALGDGRDFGVRLGYSHERTILGTGGGPRRVLDRLGRGPVLIVNGDMLFDFDLRALVREHRRSGAAVTLGVRPMPRGGRYAPVVVGRGGEVTWLRGASAAPPRSGRRTLFTGLHVVDPALFARLPPGPSDSVADLYSRLIAEGRGDVVKAFALEGAWYDLGSPRLYLRAQLELLRARFRGARAVDPTARIAADARVREAVIGAGCVVAPGARVERSVLWPGAVVGPGAVVQDAVLARGAVVPRGGTALGVIQARATAALRREPGCELDKGQARFAGALHEPRGA
jgi:NDP-sugar pyrophosphorylase family protein